MTAYGGQYTYDRWDGHTADIDPATHTIKRKAGSVLLLSQNALAAFSRKMRDKGAQVAAPRRSFRRLEAGSPVFPVLE